jgi:dihydroorotase
LNGPAWYGLQPNEERITLVRRSEPVAFPAKVETGAGTVTVFDPMFPLHWDVEG